MENGRFGEDIGGRYRGGKREVGEICISELIVLHRGDVGSCCCGWEGGGGVPILVPFF